MVAPLRSTHLNAGDGHVSEKHDGAQGDLPDPGIEPGSPALLEKEMATHSSTFAWKTPWTEEPGRLQSMGSLRVGHD